MFTILLHVVALVPTCISLMHSTVAAYQGAQTDMDKARVIVRGLESLLAELNSAIS